MQSSEEHSVVEILQNLVSIPSVFPEEAEVSHFVHARLEKLGFQVETVLTDGVRPNLVAHCVDATRFLGLYGHMDTVPPAQDYEVDPFRVRIEEGIARGLGVCDMKGGLAILLCLAEFVASRKLPVKFIFGVDEENISQGAHDLVGSGLLSDVDFLIAAETGQVVDNAQSFNVVLGRKGRILIDVAVLGEAAHAAESHLGNNAIERASELIARIAKLEFPAHERLGSTQLIVQAIHAQADSFSVPSRCEFQFSALTSPGINSEDVMARVLAEAEALGLSIQIQTAPRPTPYGEAFEMPLDNDFYAQIRRHVIDPSGVRPVYAGSVADENVFASGLQIPVMALGAMGGGDHTKDEWVRVSSLETTLCAYQSIVECYRASAPTN